MVRQRRRFTAFAACTLAVVGCGTDNSIAGDASDAAAPHDHIHALEDGSPDHVHVTDAALEVDASPDHVHVTDAALEVDASPDAPPPDAARDRSRDLEVQMTGFAAAVGRVARFRLVSSAGRLDAVATLDALTTGSDRFTLAGAVLEPGARLDWWIDDNANGRYDGPTVDRSYRTPMPPTAPYAMSLAPAGAAVDLGADTVSTAGDLVGNFTGFEVHVGIPFEVTVSVADTDRLVGLIRLSGLPASGEVNFTVGGVIQPGVRYTAFWYIDLNRNGSFDRYGDHFATLTGSIDERGFVIRHDHHVNRTWRD